jgi:hypothetical protein
MRHLAEQSLNEMRRRNSDVPGRRDRITRRSAERPTEMRQSIHGRIVKSMFPISILPWYLSARGFLACSQKTAPLPDDGRQSSAGMGSPPQSARCFQRS